MWSQISSRSNIHRGKQLRTVPSAGIKTERRVAEAPALFADTLLYGAHVTTEGVKIRKSSCIHQSKQASKWKTSVYEIFNRGKQRRSNKAMLDGDNERNGAWSSVADKWSWTKSIIRNNSWICDLNVCLNWLNSEGSLNIKPVVVGSDILQREVWVGWRFCQLS